jgi:hypothetical protein
MAIVLVQHKANFATDSGDTLAVTVDPTGSGNLLIAMAGGYGNGATVTGVSDGTNNFSQVGSARATFGSGQHWTDVWILTPSASGKTSITLTITGSGNRTKYLWVFEVSGIDNPTPEAVNVVTDGSSASPLPGASVSIAVADTFICSHSINDSVITAVGNTFTEGDIQDGNASGYKITGATGSYNANFTANSTTTYCNSTVAFKSGNPVFAKIRPDFSTFPKASMRLE